MYYYFQSIISSIISKYKNNKTLYICPFFSAVKFVFLETDYKFYNLADFNFKITTQTKN